MIEIGAMGNSGKAAMQRILQEMEAATGENADLAAASPKPARRRATGGAMSRRCIVPPRR